MIDYTKQCWYCGKVIMVPKGNYYECSECGATHTKLPDLGQYDALVVTSRSPDPGQMFRPKRMTGKIKGGLPLKPLRRPSDPKYGK